MDKATWEFKKNTSSYVWKDFSIQREYMPDRWAAYQGKTEIYDSRDLMEAMDYCEKLQERLE